MLIHGFPPLAKLPGDGCGRDRFWYWRGASGRSYIHSIYERESCPPLPGAVYVAVRRLGPMRIAVGAGRFPSFWDGTCSAVQVEADEIHVHLLARNDAGAESIRRDLDAALAAGRVQPVAAPA